MLFKNADNESNKKIYNIDVIYGLFIILVLVGKVVRYTILKTVLVDSGIGHYFVNPILYGDLHFTILDTDSMVGEAGGNAIVIFKLINFFKLSSYTSWEIYISAIWNMILLALLVGLKKKIDIKQLVFISLSIMVLNIFDFTLAKEPIQMLYFILMYLVLCSMNISEKTRYLCIIGVLLLSAFTFRAYYLLIIMFMVLIKILFKFFIFNKEKVTFKNIMYLLLSIVGFYFVFLNIVKIAMPSEYSELIRVRIRSSSAASDMKNIFMSSNLLIFSFDYVLMLIRMLCPVELLRLGVKYIPYVIYQLVITYYIIKGMRNIRNNGKIKNLALYLYIGFLLASATFEPDFGSWVRHETVAFPIMLIIADIKRNGEDD